MRQGSRCILVALVVACAVAVAPAQAQGNVNQSKVVTQGTTTKKLAVASRAGERCRARRAEHWVKNIFRQKVIRFFQTVKWCWNRERITYTRRRNRGTTPWPVWDYLGITQPYRDASRTRGRWYRFVATGKFALCGGGFCAQNKFLTIRQTVHRGGGYTVDLS